MPYRILLRRDNSATWLYNDPVLMTGEPGYETDTGKLKIGDGQSPWSALDYYIGLTGATGNVGATGATGAAGTSGTSGVSGTSGTSGVDGNFYGSSGTSGINGATGAAGTSGVNGSSGTSGINGATGAAGTSGTSGINGATGAAGTSGTSGTSGETPAYSQIPYLYQDLGSVEINKDGTKPLNTGRMLGLGVNYIPTSIGTLNIGFNFGVDITSDFDPLDNFTFGIRYGTGSAPSNSDPLTGTLIAEQSYGPVGDQQGITNMYINSIISGLTAGTTYWFDLSLISSEVNPPTANFTGNDITLSLIELSGGKGPTGASITISGIPGVTSSPAGWGKINISGSDYWVQLYQ